MSSHSHSHTHPDILLVHFTMYTSVHTSLLHADHFSYTCALHTLAQTVHTAHTHIYTDTHALRTTTDTVERRHSERTDIFQLNGLSGMIANTLLGKLNCIMFIIYMRFIYNNFIRLLSALVRYLPLLFGVKRTTATTPTMRLSLARYNKMSVFNANAHWNCIEAAESAESVDVDAICVMTWCSKRIWDTNVCTTSNAEMLRELYSERASENMEKHEMRLILCSLKNRNYIIMRLY